jgi:hypothetical protein
MANENPTDPGRSGRPTTADQDDRDQASVLRKILFIYPEPITLAELIRERTIASTDFAERDRIERAVRDLIAAGLIYPREDDLVLPTRAAVNFHALEDL